MSKQKASSSAVSGERVALPLLVQAGDLRPLPMAGQPGLGLVRQGQGLLGQGLAAAW